MTASGTVRRKPWEVEDGLWEWIEPLLPVVERRYRYPGRKRLDQRKVMCGILFVLYTGIRWEFLPQELGFGSGMTCWRRLRDWNVGVTEPRIRTGEGPSLPGDGGHWL